MARSCPCRCWPRYCDGDRARRLSQVPPICGVPPLVLSGCCIDLRMRVVAYRGWGEKYSTNDTAHSLAHTVDSVVYSDSVLHNARLLSRLTTCGAAWWAWATGLSLSCRHRLCVDQEMGGAHTLTHTRTRTLMHTLYGLAGLSSVVAARPSFLGRSLLIYVTCDRRAFLPRAGDY